MRNTLIILLTALSLSTFGALGCDNGPIGDNNNDDGSGNNGDGDGGDGGSDSSGTSLVIQAPTFTVAPGQEVTQCYYTTLGNAVELGVNKWTSEMTAGSHHMILFFTDSPLKPDGTLEPDCGFGGSGFNQPQWTFSAQDPHTEFQLPTGVGMAVKPNQPVFVQMHYLNASDQPLEANVKITANTFASGESFEQAQPYVTYNTNIDVEPNQSGSVSGSCDVPSGANFFVMSTHSHHFSTGAQVHDSGNMLVNTTDWEHPETVQWDTPHYQFNGKLDYSCNYFNPTNQAVKTGDSAESDEMCMAVGYFFPGNKPVLCINSFVIP